MSKSASSTGRVGPDDLAGFLDEAAAKLDVNEKPTEVDPGQLVCVRATFRGDPERVLFSHLAPGEKRAVHDPGYGRAGSRIQRLDEGRYQVLVDTRGMRGGVGWYYLQTEDDARPLELQRSKIGQFEVRDVPAALLDRRGGPPASESDYLRGCDVLGVEPAADPSASFKKFLGSRAGKRTAVGVAIAAAVTIAWAAA